MLITLVTISPIRVLAVGGCKDNYVPLNSTYSYDVENDEWTKEQDLPLPCYGSNCHKVFFRGRDRVLCFFCVKFCFKFSFLHIFIQCEEKNIISVRKISGAALVIFGIVLIIRVII